MTLPPAIASAVIAAAAKELAATMAANAEDIQLVSFREAGAMLGITEQQARRIFKSHVDLGGRTRRVSIQAIRKLIEKRTVHQ
jgi:hypothetical protein